jgi:hypothetical protein
MAPHTRVTVPAGATARSVLLYATGAGGGPAAGLRAGDGTAALVREGEAEPHDLPLIETGPGTWQAGGWAEVDPDVAPGVYELGIPDEALALGSTQAFVMVRFPGAGIEPVELSVVRYDPQEGERIAMECLIMEVRREFLRQGLPRLAEMELALRAGADPTAAAREELTP